MTYPRLVLSELTVGLLILAAGLGTGVAGVGLRSHVGRKPDARIGRLTRSFRESAVLNSYSQYPKRSMALVSLRQFFCTRTKSFR